MRLAYADPPYVGQAKKHYSHDPKCAEVDHAALFRQLSEYDGWALSLSSPSLGFLLSDGARQRAADIERMRKYAAIPMPPADTPLQNALLDAARWLERQPLDPMAPAGSRIASWVKPCASFKPGVNPGYCWEPVIFSPARSGERDRPTVRDWHSENITLRKGLAGAKPPGFCLWLFELLGAREGDTFDDLFPGTGGVSAAWHTRFGPSEPDRAQQHAASAGAAPSIVGTGSEGGG